MHYIPHVLASSCNIFRWKVAQSIYSAWDLPLHKQRSILLWGRLLATHKRRDEKENGKDKNLVMLGFPALEEIHFPSEVCVILCSWWDLGQSRRLIVNGVKESYSVELLEYSLPSARTNIS